MPEVLNAKILDANEVVKECEALEVALAELRAAYEQYFLGMERHPPTDQRKELKQRLARLKSGFIRQTAAKFRVNNLQQKVSTYERMWDRTIQEIENGTYRRDLFKASLRARQREGKPAEKEKQAHKPQEQQAQPQQAQGQLQPRANSSPPPSGQLLSDQKLRAVFDAYVTAKRRCNEDVSKLTYDALASQLRKTVPELLKQHNAKSVEFKIVIKDGKAVLRAIPK